MSEQNMEVVERFLDAASRDDLEGTLECLHPDLEFVPLRVSTEGAFRGHEGFERFREDTWEHYDTFEPRYELRDLGAHGVLVWGAICVRGKGSGLKLEVPSAGIFEFREGKIVRWQDFVSKERALEEAGLPRSA